MVSSDLIVSPEELATWDPARRQEYLDLMGDILQSPGTWYQDPLGWVDHLLAGVDLAPYQREILEAFRDHLRGTAKGPRGLGKTAVAALIILWFITTREARGTDWKVGTTSGSWGQLKHYLWPEVHKWNRMLPDGVRLSPRVLLEMSVNGAHGNAFAASPAKPELIEGLHADSVLVVFDEAKVIQPGLFDSIEGAALNVESQETFMLVVSTPGAPMGRFHDIHRRLPGYEDWFVRAVSLQECLEAGRASQSEVDRLARAWGETSSMFRNHVLGEFAADDAESLIPHSWVEAAQQRWREARDEGRLRPEGGEVRHGLDVARQGADHTVLATVVGLVVQELWREPFTDNVSTLADRTAVMCPDGHVAVDADGMGAGTADRLRTLIGDGRVTVFQGGPRPEHWRDRSREMEAFNTRAAAWWNLRELLDPAHDSQLCLPPDDGLAGDLTAPRQVVDPAGRIKIERKDVTKKRLGRSPDCGDAVVMALWDAHGNAVEYTAAQDHMASQTGHVFDPAAFMRGE